MHQGDVDDGLAQGCHKKGYSAVSQGLEGKGDVEIKEGKGRGQTAET